MLHMIEANWVAFALALVIGLLVAWWLFGRTAKEGRRERRPDVLDEGAAPAQRNQALIDAPSAAASATAPPPATTAASFAGAGPDILGGIGEIIGAAAAEEVADAAPPPRAAEPNPPAIEADDLLLIKGLGPKLVALLHGLGITTFAEIAAWSEADIDRIDPQLGAFAGRIRRDNWVEQAKFLAAGDKAGFEGKFGKL
jgi:predicted flap endonuclease-1-like 5' DNA nuclease